jgi:hypothetical protein
MKMRSTTSHKRDKFLTTSYAVIRAYKNNDG